MPAGECGVRDRDNVLRIETETVLIEGALDTANPFHLAFASGKLSVIRTIYLNPIAPLLFRHIAGAVSGAERLCQAKCCCLKAHQAHTYANGKGATLPDKGR